MDAVARVIQRGSLRVVAFVWPLDRTLFWPAQDSRFAAYMGARMDHMFIRSKEIVGYDLTIRIWDGSAWVDWYNADGLTGAALITRFRAECLWSGTKPDDVLMTQNLFVEFCERKSINFATHQRHLENAA